MPDLASAVNYFRNALNLTVEQASGIVGNLFGESELNPNAVGDNGQAFGIAQWHMPRVQQILNATGIDVRTASLEDQYKAITWELQNTEKNSYKSLLGTGTIADATRSFMNMFERPANDSSLGNRTAAANAAANGSTDTNFLSNPIGTVTNALTPTWLQNLLNGHTAARWTSVVIGIILIGLAIAAFVLLRGDDLKAAVVKATV